MLSSNSGHWHFVSKRKAHHRGSESLQLRALVVGSSRGPAGPGEKDRESNFEGRGLLQALPWSFRVTTLLTVTRPGGQRARSVLDGGRSLRVPGPASRPSAPKSPSALPQHWQAGDTARLCGSYRDVRVTPAIQVRHHMVKRSPLIRHSKGCLSLPFG
jgi:hypothetical protein